MTLTRETRLRGSTEVGATRCLSIKMTDAEQARVNGNVTMLSQKLLEGCKLLSESCPETNVPLVSTLDGRMLSVGNGCYYVRDGAELVKLDTPAASAETITKVAEAAAASSPERASWPPMIVPEIPSISGSSLSSKVAEKLLDGYTLLSESCPQTSVPLVQDADGHILSVGTNKWHAEITPADTCIDTHHTPKCPAA